MTLQGPHKDFALHTVGWQAFQDLATTIVEVGFGRQVHRVAPVKDQGRDGFFYGVPDETVTPSDKRETTIQAKHFATPTKTLTVGDLARELEPVRELAKTGRAHGYILVTNASVTEANRIKIAAALTEVGVDRAYVLGRQWVTSKILEHPKVRALAPRVYGLGDLSWIQSDVARKQALAILDTMGEGLRRYVPTNAHRAAVDALAKHRFVLLLGDPAVGKSSIAAALSVAATDEQQCDVIFVRNPGEFLKNWDPEIENRLFWVDDAFGTTKLESALMDPWNKILSSMQAAIKRGNRFILTSRSHIWKQANRDLKQGAFPPLSHGHVVVDVEALTDAERKRIVVTTTPLPSGAFTISGNTMAVTVPISMLPSTGFDTDHYTFLLWSRTQPAAGVPQQLGIADFAPNQGSLSLLPEPSTWEMMLVGFGTMGFLLRRRRSNSRLMCRHSPGGTRTQGAESLRPIADICPQLGCVFYKLV
jgi:energy-coupling factor transporter ATP-binding protein EcfA2